jgi:hypothetical protein
MTAPMHAIAAGTARTPAVALWRAYRTAGRSRPETASRVLAAWRTGRLGHRVLHNVVAHPLLELCPPLGERLHDRWSPEPVNSDHLTWSDDDTGVAMFAGEWVELQGGTLDGGFALPVAGGWVDLTFSSQAELERLAAMTPDERYAEAERRGLLEPAPDWLSTVVERAGNHDLAEHPMGAGLSAVPDASADYVAAPHPKANPSKPGRWPRPRGSRPSGGVW